MLAEKLNAEKLINEETIEEKFVIDNDIKAEWAITKIKKEKKEKERLIQVCNEMITYYQNEISKIENKYINNISYLQSILYEYFKTKENETKETKTMKKYKLPSGELILKKSYKKIEKDDESLLEFLKANDKKEYIKIKETVNWGELKKKLIITDNNSVVNEDGEIIEGVMVTEVPDTFEVKAGEE